MWISFIIYCVLSMSFCQCQDFGYEGNLGPSHWGEKFQQCVGKHQSPINIVEHNVHVVDFPPISFRNFDAMPKSAQLTNNGHTVTVTLSTDKMPTISGGPLIEEYQFVQLHFHWGANDGEGSETTINNSSFPMELHMVFYQLSYGSYQEAMSHPDGLTVLSFLFNSSSEENENYNSVIESLANLKDVGATATITNLPSLTDLTIKERSVYFTYGGSLTTPPCSEVVTWIEFKQTIPLTHTQIEHFRQLNGENGKMSHNFRPTQPLHGRIIRMARDTSNLKKMNRNTDTDNNSQAHINIVNALLTVLITIVCIQM